MEIIVVIDNTMVMLSGMYCCNRFVVLMVQMNRYEPVWKAPLKIPEFSDKTDNYVKTSTLLVFNKLFRKICNLY